MRIDKIIVILLTLLLFSCTRNGNIVYVFDSNRNGGDAVLSIPNPNYNRGLEKEINIYCDTLNGKTYINRAVVSFDIKKLPESAKIDSVFLQLYFNDNSGFYKIKKPGHSGYTGLIIESIEEVWHEKSINWNTYPKIGKEKLYFESHKIIDQDFRLNVTQLFIATDRKVKNKFGFLIRLEKEEIGNYVHLSSRENQNNNNGSPKLKIYAKE